MLFYRILLARLLASCILCTAERGTAARECERVHARQRVFVTKRVQLPTNCSVQFYGPVRLRAPHARSHTTGQQRTVVTPGSLHVQRSPAAPRMDGMDMHTPAAQALPSRTVRASTGGATASDSTLLPRLPSPGLRVRATGHMLNWLAMEAVL